MCCRLQLSSADSKWHEMPPSVCCKKGLAAHLKSLPHIGMRFVSVLVKIPSFMGRLHAVLYPRHSFGGTCQKQNGAKSCKQGLCLAFVL